MKFVILLKFQLKNKECDKKKLKFIIQLIRGMLSYKNINNNNFY